MSSDPERPNKRLPLRWLTLAEIVGVAALALAGLGYWDSHRERLQQDQERVQAEHERKAAEAEQGKARVQEAQKEAARQALLLIATPGADQMRLQATRQSQVIQTQTLWFPTEIRELSVSTTGNPRIETGWIEDRVRRVAKADDHRLPVAIETTFIEDGETRTDRAVYWIGYSLHGRLVGGPKLQFEGLSLARRGVTGDLQAAANGLWIGRR